MLKVFKIVVTKRILQIVTIFFEKSIVNLILHCRCKILQ